MIQDKSWGLLGRPPASVLNGTAPKHKMDLFKDYQKEAAKVSKMANAKGRAVKIAELKARFKRDFPPEVYNGTTEQRSDQEGRD